MASSTSTVVPSTHVCQPSSSTPRPSLDRTSDRAIGRNTKQLTVSSHPPEAAELNSYKESYPNTTNSLRQGASSVAGGYEWLTITASIVVSIQVPLLTANSAELSVIPRIFLTLGLMSELVGIMLIVYFIRFPENDSHKSSNNLRTVNRAALEAPTFLILTGIIGVAVALVVEMLGISIGAAIAMSGVLILGVMFCFLAWYLGIGGRAMV